MSNQCWLIDTNVFIYARDPRNKDKQDKARQWLIRARDFGRLAVSPQIVGEFANVLSRREFELSIGQINEAVEELTTYSRSETSNAMLRSAAGIRASTGFQWWDCIILANAVDCGASHLISEDYQHRRVINGVIIINPFLETPDEVHASSSQT